MTTTKYGKVNEYGNLDLLRRVPNITNASAETFKAYAEANGYYPIENSDSPGEWYTSKYTLENGKCVQKWEPFDLPTRMRICVDNTQRMMDSVARERQYDNIFTAITYLDDANPKFAAEAKALKEWRGAVWTALYDLQAKVEKGEVEAPTSWEEVKTYLPTFTWPE